MSEKLIDFIGLETRAGLIGELRKLHSAPPANSVASRFVALCNLYPNKTRVELDKASSFGEFLRLLHAEGVLKKQTDNDAERIDLEGSLVQNLIDCTPSLSLKGDVAIARDIAAKAHIHELPLCQSLAPAFSGILSGLPADGKAEVIVNRLRDTFGSKKVLNGFDIRANAIKPMFVNYALWLLEFGKACGYWQ